MHCEHVTRLCANNIEHEVLSQQTEDIENQPNWWPGASIVLLIGALLGGLLSGYDTGVVAGVLLALKPGDIARTIISDTDRSLIASSTAMGALFGSLIAGRTANQYGRRTTLLWSGLIFTGSSVWLALATSLSSLALARLSVGIAIGAASQCTPLLLSELAPTKIRGAILSCYTLSVTAGQCLAYFAAFTLSNRDQSWRILFALGFPPSLLYCCALIIFPESPRWYITQGEYDDAHRSLQAVYPTATHLQVSRKIQALAHDLVAEESQALLPNVASTYKKPKISHTIRGLVIGCTLMAFQQLSGFNALMYYATIIFKRLGTESPLIPAMCIAATNFFFTIFAILVVDNIGRRSMLLYTLWVMPLALVSASSGLKSGNFTTIVISILLYVAAYASALGTVPWTCVEFLPMEQRSLGASCFSCTNWITNTIVSASFLSMVTKLGVSCTFLIFSFICCMSWVFVYFWFPEVKGLTLEEINQVFKNGIDVNYVYRNYH